MEGSHSPFGLMWQVASATGWSIHYITRRISYPMLLLMVADAPRLVKEKNKKKGSAISLFQTMLPKE